MSNPELYQFGDHYYTDNPQSIPLANKPIDIISSYNPPSNLDLYLLRGEQPEQSMVWPSLKPGKASTVVMAPADYQLGGAAGINPETNRPTMMVYDNYPKRMPNKDEFKFMIAHELGHLQQGHSYKDHAQQEAIRENPYTSSGLTWLPYSKKLDEREADLAGQRMYLNAGYNPALFANGAVTPYEPGREISSMSPRDEHPSPADRNAYLKQGLMGWVTEKDNAARMGNYMRQLQKEKK